MGWVGDCWTKYRLVEDGVPTLATLRYDSMSIMKGILEVIKGYPGVENLGGTFVLSAFFGLRLGMVERGEERRFQFCSHHPIYGRLLLAGFKGSHLPFSLSP